MAQISEMDLEQVSSTRERMLDAALEAFSELGYDGASTREIAGRAGVNQGLIPYYFGSKLGLWQEAVGRAFSVIQGQLEHEIETADASDGRKVAAQVIRAVVRLVAGNPDFHRLMTNEGKRDGPRLQWIVDQHVRPLYEVMGEIARRAGSKTLLAQLDPVLAHYLLVGASTHLYHQAPECLRLTGRDPNEPDLIEAHAEALVSMFLGPEESGVRGASKRKRS